MAIYRFQFLNGRNIVHEANRERANDLDALEDARHLSVNFEIIVWQGDRFVARADKGKIVLSTPA